MKLTLTMKTNRGIRCEVEVDPEGRGPHETVRAVSDAFGVPIRLHGDLAALEASIEVGQGVYEVAVLDYAEWTDSAVRLMQIRDTLRTVQKRVCPHTPPSELGACEACGAVLVEAWP